MKTAKIITLIVSIAIIILARFIFIDTSGLYNISIWGVYLFCVPIIYCIMSLMKTQTKASLFKGVIYATIGMVITILLSTDIVNSFWLQKILMTLVGAGISWIVISKYE